MSLLRLSQKDAVVYSDIPLRRAVAGVTVALVDDELIVNPTSEQQTSSQLDLTIAGTAEAILMIEGFCDFLTEEQMLEVHPTPQSACCIHDHGTSLISLWITGFDNRLRCHCTHLPGSARMGG